MKENNTHSPTDAWTAQHLREATAYGAGPKYLIRDHDGKFGMSFARVQRFTVVDNSDFSPNRLTAR